MTVSYFVNLAERRIEVALGASALRADRRRALEAVLELLAEHAGFGVFIDACLPMRPLSGDEARWIVETVGSHRCLFEGGVALLAEPALSYGAPRLRQAKESLAGLALGVFCQRDTAIWWLTSVGRGARERAGR